MRALAAVAGATADLSAVSLPDVLARADLQTRSDRKYLVPVPAFGEFVRSLADQVAALQVDHLSRTIAMGLCYGATSSTEGK